MAGTVGAGGLGDIAIRYGYQRFETELMWITVAILAVVISVISVIRFAGDYAARSLHRRGGTFGPVPRLRLLKASTATGKTVQDHRRTRRRSPHPRAHRLRRGPGRHRLRVRHERSAGRRRRPDPARRDPHLRRQPAKDAGLDLEVKEFTDCVTPNTATEDGSVNATTSRTSRTSTTSTRRTAPTSPPSSRSTWSRSASTRTRSRARPTSRAAPPSPSRTTASTRRVPSNSWTRTGPSRSRAAWATRRPRPTSPRTPGS